MFHKKFSIVIGLGLFIMLMGTSAFARNEYANPLTGQIGVAPDDDSPESIKIRSGTGDPVAGKLKSELCQGCHGTEGISKEGLIPKLAGQYAKYIAKEVRNYQSGVRSHQIMNAMAGTITSDEDLADIAAYFASRPKMKGAGSENEVGKKLFLHGDLSRTVVACINCHGVNGKGLTPNTSMFPVIGGQQKDYIRRQLTNFKADERTNSPNLIMNRITHKLSDDEIEGLADYVSGQ